MYKKIVAFLLLLSFATVLCQRGFSQELPPLSQEFKALNPQNIFPADPAKNYSFVDRSKPDFPSSFLVKPGIGGAAVMVAEVLASLPSPYDVQVTWKSVSPVKKGDVLLARFVMHAVYAKQESGDAVVNFYVQQPQPPFEKSTMTQVSANAAWKVFNIPFVALSDMPAGAAAICFSFGDLSQKVEISSLEVFNFGQKTTLNKLPVTLFTYNGREEKSAWRDAALKRIEKIRTAPLAIKVVDAKGRAMQGVKVNARLVQPDFIFGTAVSAGLLCKDAVNSETYRQKIKQLFNTVTLDNGLKWGPWINPASQQKTKEAIAWINSKGLRLRGHNLVWPSKKFSPDSYRNKPNFGPGFQDSISSHIKDIVSYTKGKVIAWDVINEMAHENDYFDVMPRSVAADWFKLAHQIDPGVQLFINEYGMLNSPSSPKMIKTYLDLITELRADGAPIEAMGVQGHVGKQPRDPAQVLTDLDLLAKAGLPIQITEFDVNTPDEKLQADYTRDFLIACFSHPSVTGFTMWGFWEPAHWKPDAAMFRKDWSPKLNAAVWKELVTKKWTTNITETTSKTGAINASGYLGRYEITITKKGSSPVKKYLRLTTAGSPVVIKI